ARLDSNQQPAPYKSDALTVELRARVLLKAKFFSDFFRGKPGFVFVFVFGAAFRHHFGKFLVPGGAFDFNGESSLSPTSKPCQASMEASTKRSPSADSRMTFRRRAFLSKLFRTFAREGMVTGFIIPFAPTQAC